MHVRLIFFQILHRTAQHQLDSLPVSLSLREGSRLEKQVNKRNKISLVERAVVVCTRRCHISKLITIEGLVVDNIAVVPAV
jgi:hypothetical protein